MRRYEIIIKGHIDGQYREWLDGVTLVHVAGGNTAVVSQIPDQAALYGILIRCRDLGLTLLSVNALPQPDDE